MTTKKQQNSNGNAIETLQDVAIVKFNAVEERSITLRGEKVLLDSDVAGLYGVETKRVNEAVSNNPDKFPERYIFELTKDEHFSLRSKISTLEKNGQWQSSLPHPAAFNRNR